MANPDIKQKIIISRKIITSLGSFNTGQLSANALNLFQALGYNTERQAPFDKPNYATFKDSFVDTQSKFDEKKALVKDWEYVDLLFQLSKEEVRKQISLFDTKKVDSTIIETYLFFTIALVKDQYSRTELSNITREVNHLFPMPVMILFKYGKSLTLSVINRRQHKRDESKDVLEKITLIKDINFENPHRAHVEILFDLSFDELKSKHGFTNFVELHNAWQKTLDTKELNKHFFQKLANWYFWATDYVSFPDDMEKDENIRNATSLIRFITRIIFIWFIKEKSLVPEALFDRTELNRILKEFAKNKKSNSYYHAILQNLFFGTLNQKMNERGFAKEGSFEENKTNYGIKNLFRYANHFTVSEKEVLSLFKDIPFLNGGLFDCLDKENDDGKVLYSDGFSRNPKKQALVPDFLFFGEEEEYDLNAIYGTKNKRYKVKGLIDILSDYKFTVAENTPVEEEVALDPELLGKVFENLLASYNPETQTTARKQTGSFYTPREIVNYMVDESLKAYLKQKLETDAAIKPEDAEMGLEILFSYTEKEHAFTDRETKTLVDAIDNCKILDPACGSGAFPMGVLHKLVHVLHKLDPQNARWKERQISKARQIDDPAVREQSVAGIEEAFANNELDYGRKLYLIENCIYGVDIQPIAVQIAKLRFFISLVVDQKKNPVRKNMGILSLPNLETKFVAANTLIGLDKPQTGGQISFKNPEIEKLEDDLKALRHQYFNARTRREKLACQKKDRDLRKRISELLEKDGWNKDSASQVAAFDPYDQNARSPFFDPEWMFGLRDRFDVVIGNPPWGAKLSAQEKELFKTTYNEIDSSTPNSFAYFIGWANKNYNCVISYVLPDSILIKDYSKTRSLIKDNVLEIVWYENTGIPEEYRPFVYVDHDVCVINILKKKSETLKYSLFRFNSLIKDVQEQKFVQSKSKIILKEFDFAFNLIAQDKDFIILNHIEQFDKLDDFMQCHEGIHTGNSRELLFVEGKKNKHCHPLFYGGGAGDLIDNYFSQTSGWYVDYRTELVDKNKGFYASLRDERIFKTPKIYITRTGNPFKAFYDEGTYASNNFFSLQHSDYSINNKEFLKFILPFIISKPAQYFIRTFAAPRLGSTFIETKIFHLLKFRIPTKTKFKNVFVNLVDYIFILKNKNIDSTFFQRVIDAMVYELYLPEALQTAGCVVLKYLRDLPELKEDWGEEKKLKTIDRVYNELSNPNHPVSIAMFKMDTIEEIRIIEGKQ